MNPSKDFAFRFVNENYLIENWKPTNIVYFTENTKTANRPHIDDDDAKGAGLAVLNSKLIAWVCYILVSRKISVVNSENVVLEAQLASYTGWVSLCEIELR